MTRRQVLVWFLLAAVLLLITLGVAHLLHADSEVYSIMFGIDRSPSIKESPQFDGKRFVNPEPTARKIEGSYWTLLKNYLFSQDNKKPSVQLPTVTPDLSGFASGSGLRAIWLGHSTVLVRIDGVTLLLDPVFDENIAVLIGSTKRFQPAPLNREDLPHVDAVIISHDHYDHLEKNTIRYLAPLGAKFFVPLGVGAHLRRWHVPDSQIIECDWWQSEQFKNLELVCTPARHFSGRTPFTFNRTLWASWAILGSEQRLYFSGDTGFTDQFETIGKRFGPFDLTLLPIGTYDKAWADIHLNPEEAVRAHLELRGRALLPIHWGTFDVALHPWNEPIEWFMRAAIEYDIETITPHLGETVVLPLTLQHGRWWKTII